MNILKVIVDELPVSCFDCQYSDFVNHSCLECLVQNMIVAGIGQSYGPTRHPACPLEENGEILRLREDNERLRTQNKQLLEVVGFMESEE